MNPSYSITWNKLYFFAFEDTEELSKARFFYILGFLHFGGSVYLLLQTQYYKRSISKKNIYNVSMSTLRIILRWIFAETCIIYKNDRGQNSFPFCELFFYILNTFFLVSTTHIYVLALTYKKVEKLWGFQGKVKRQGWMDKAMENGFPHSQSEPQMSWSTDFRLY